MNILDSGHKHIKAIPNEFFSKSKIIRQHHVALKPLAVTDLMLAVADT